MIYLGVLGYLNMSKYNIKILEKIMPIQSVNYMVKRYIFCRNQIRRIADCGRYMMEASQLHRILMNRGFNPQALFLGQ